jgi:hypothetical protein
MSSRTRRRQPNRSSSSAPRRPAVRVAEPIDHTLEYASIRRDLWRITFWTVLLLVGMFVLYFVIG